MYNFFPERIEKFFVELTIKKDIKNNSTEANAINELFEKDNIKCYKYDTLNIDFNIEYYNIVKRIENIINLLDSKDIEVTKVNTKELNHQKCLIQELLCKLEQIENKYNKPQ